MLICITLIHAQSAVDFGQAQARAQERGQLKFDYHVSNTTSANNPFRWMI